MCSYRPRNRKFQKNSKKIKKIKKHHYSFFESKTSWESLRNSENKNFHSEQFLPDPLEGIPKKKQKNSKN